jgi:hypothetical protein
MTLAVREQVLQAILAKLAAISIDGLTVDRNRQDEIQAWPCLVVTDGDQTTDPDQTVFVQHFMEVIVTGYVRVPDKADLGAALNELYASAVRAMTADPALNGTAIDVTEGELTTFMDPPSDTERQGQFDVKFSVLYATRHGDPFTIGP